MRYFSDAALAGIERDYNAVKDAYAALSEAVIFREYANDRAREYAHHGLARRLKILITCISNVYELLPPSLDGIPSDDDRYDATINLQAFVFNVFGCLDNLAWIWVTEKDIRLPNGKPLPPMFVGLGAKNECVMESLPKEIQDYLATLTDWIANLEDFRHALAHRISFYVPPHLVTPENSEAYQALEEQKIEAAARADHAEYDRLEGEQMELAFFRPWMTHSFLDNSEKVIFHTQMLCDFMAVHTLATKFLVELSK